MMTEMVLSIEILNVDRPGKLINSCNAWKCCGHGCWYHYRRRIRQDFFFICKGYFNAAHWYDDGGAISLIWSLRLKKQLPKPSAEVELLT